MALSLVLHVLVHIYLKMTVIYHFEKYKEEKIKKDSKMKRILARMLVVALVLQMGLPLNVMAAPSELQETETETEAPLREEISESEEASEEATEEVATEEISEESTEENTEEVLEPISSEEEMDDLGATGEDCTELKRMVKRKETSPAKRELTSLFSKYFIRKRCLFLGRCLLHYCKAD